MCRIGNNFPVTAHLVNFDKQSILIQIMYIIQMIFQNSALRGALK